MTARDRASVLRRRVSEIKEAQKHEKHADALEDKRQALEGYRSTLQAAVESAGVLVKNGCLESDALPDLEKLDDALKKIVQAFTDDPGSITKGRNFTTLSRYLETATTELANASREAWTREVINAHETPDTLLSQIERLPGQAQAVRQHRSACQNLADASKKPPTNQSEWDNYQTLRRLVEGQREVLSSDHFPKQVLDFYNKALSNGAPLSMLTDEVRAWLKEHGMLDDLRYRFK